jgi:transcription termination factor 2
MFAAIKFLRCRPFNELSYWKTWIEVRGGKGTSPRLQALLKSILLRRTKKELIEKGELNELPDKKVEIIPVKFTRDERIIYSKMLALSQSVLATFLLQQLKKSDRMERFDPIKAREIHQKYARLHKVDREIAAHEILVLLLRMRQVCCHAALVKAMIDSEEFQNELSEELNSSDAQNDSYMNVLNKLKEMNIDDNKNENDVNEDIFDKSTPSSKVKKLMEILRDKIENNPGDKVIIVSQWTSFLDIIKPLLEDAGIHYCELTGKVLVKNRNDVVVDFNNPSSKTKVMLLSITAGGVGLNLVGANHLFIMDLHYNPQIEQQAQDRIYRFGQTKDVIVYK